MEIVDQVSGREFVAADPFERILPHIGEETTPLRVLATRPPPQLEISFAQTAGPATWDEVNQTTEFLDEP